MPDQSFISKIVPAQTRTFLDTLAGNRAPITEKNFTSDELQQMRDAIQHSRMQPRNMYRSTDPNLSFEQAQKTRSGIEKIPLAERTKGSVGYSDYGNNRGRDDWDFTSSGAIRNTLGRFAYHKDPETGHLIATDTYKFTNDLPKITRPTSDYQGMSTFDKIKTIAADTFRSDGGFNSLPSRIGNAFIGSDGRPVNVDLGEANFKQGGLMFRPMAHHPHNMASGLASLGRGGDSTLVHMSPNEVQGLQKLALAHGGSLTINPHTGLPEAGFLSKILPMLGGVLTGIFAPEFLPEEAVATGLIGKASGETWGQAVMSGLSAYGAGAGASSIANYMATPAVTGATAETITPEINGMSANILPDASQWAGYQPATAGVGDLTVAGAPSATGVPTSFSSELEGAPGAATSATTIPGSPATSATWGAPAAPPADVPAQSAWDQFKASPTQAAKSFYQGLGSNSISRMAALGGIGTGLSGLASAAQSSIPGVTNQNEYYVQAPGGKPLFTPGTINPNIAKLGYLPAGQEAFIGQGFNPGVYTTTSPVAATPGQPVLNAKKGGLMSLRHFDAGGSTVNPSVGEQMLSAAQTNYPGPAAPTPTAQSQALSNMNAYYANQMQNPSSILPATPPPTAMNDYLSQLNQMVTPPTVTGGTPTPMPSTSPVNATVGDGTTPPASTPNTPAGLLAAARDRLGGMGNAYGDMPSMTWNPQTLSWDMGTPTSSIPSDVTVGGIPSTTTAGYPIGNDYSPSLRMASGGLADLGHTYAAGGKLLRGPGDGMSDSIPAVIGGHKPQRAALADGEFVVPADVVSHLGNGSTEAGSRKLYAMMDKVRHARTGNKKQGKQINPDNYLPA